MINEMDILTAVRDKLKSKYPAIPVYLNEVQDAYKKESFFLDLTTSCRLYRIDTYAYSCMLYIYYFGNGKDSRKLYDVRDNVQMALMRGLQVDDRYIKFNNISVEIAGDDSNIVEFALMFNYYTKTEPDQSAVKLQKLRLELKTKE